MNAGARRQIFFISIGSNLDPARHIPAGLELLKKEFTVKKISSVYETQPVGPAGPDLFWNAAAVLEMPLDAGNLVLKLRAIEKSVGRTRDPLDKFAARTLDLDLLPQKDYQKQAFIMIPLAEISPGTVDQETGKTFRELAEGLKPEGKSFRIVQPAYIMKTKYFA